MENINEIIDEILRGVAYREKVDYAKSSSVKQFNRAYDRIVRNMKYIDRYYPSELPRLLALLKSPNYKVVSTCAPIVLQLKNCTYAQKLEALTAIRSLINDPRLDNVERRGFSLSLNIWERKILGNKP